MRAHYLIFVHAGGASHTRMVANLANEGDPLVATSVAQQDVYRYLGAFAHLPLDTRHRYFREVRCFFDWLVEAGHLASSPFAHVRNVRLPTKIVQPFAQEDVQRLLAASPNTPADMRDRAIIVTLLDTGLRVSELAQLSIDDLDLEMMRLRVLHAKGNKQRVVSFSACKRDLVGYLALRPAEPGPLSCAMGWIGAPSPRCVAAVERDQADASPPGAKYGSAESARPPVPSHLRDLGNPAGRPRAGSSSSSATRRPTCPPLHVVVQR